MERTCIWSLTIDRWSISDRTPGLVYADDGSLTLYLSAEPPEVRENAAGASRSYLLGMRVYEGQHEVVACEWFHRRWIRSSDVGLG